jgi:hypothetical protein
MEEHEHTTAEHTSSNGSVSPVLAGSDARPIERFSAPALPAPVVAATGGVVMAAATYLLIRVLRRPARRGPSLRIGRGRGRKRGVLEVSGSRSFLVDVHMLKR